MFQTESRGLALLAAPKVITVPKVLAQGSAGSNAYLVLEWIEAGLKTEASWSRLGEGLANLHKVSSDHFGLDHDNYIGSLVQSNEGRASWAEFFVECRLRPQLEMAKGKFSESDMAIFESLFMRMADVFPEEKSSLLHGDLWGGNYLVSDKGEPVILDPAVYFGHREMDLAMMHLFGGFDDAVFEVYNEIYPLEENWRQRISLCNLYPLLVHVNLFGGGYISQVRDTLSLWK